MAREYPALASALGRPELRRHVLRLMAASMALGGLGGCDPSTPDGTYVPAVTQAPDIVPGVPNRYATALLDGGAAAGIVVTQEMGRPIKVEGNPAHPASLGATSIHGQALILDFYDPDRSCGLMHGPGRRLAGPGAEPAGAARSSQPTRDGLSHSHRRGRVAHSGRRDRWPAAALSGGALAPVGAGVARRRPARHGTRLRSAARPAAARRRRGRDPGTGQRSDQRRAGPPAPRPGFRLAPQSGARADEPGLRRRAGAHVDRHGRRSSLHRRTRRAARRDHRPGGRGAGGRAPADAPPWVAPWPPI